MKVLIADKFDEKGIEDLKSFGCQVTCEAKLSGDSLRDAIAKTKCEGLIVRSTKVTEEMLDGSRALALIIRAGAGYDNIDVAAASKRSIMVANCPGKNAVAVAELAFSLILALDRRLVENVNDLRNGKWNKKEYSQARGLKGRTIGILGLGQIGQSVARRAHAFGMDVVAWSRSLSSEKAENLQVLRCTSPADVASSCDILSIHLPSAPETKGLVNSEVLNRLAPGSYVINTARQDVVDYDALCNAVKTLDLRVGLDVYPKEPGATAEDFLPAIIKAKGVIYGTHHIGASTAQAQMAIADAAVEVVRVFCETGRVQNCVNLRRRGDASCTLRVRHINKPGVLAFVLNAVRTDGINVEEMENVICDGGASACAQIKLDQSLTKAKLSKIEKGHDGIIGLTQSQLTKS